MKNIERTHIAAMLRQAADAIDSGSCIMTREQANLLLDELANRPMSKEQAAIHLNMSRSNFDRLVREGVIPPGRKVAGFKELIWFSNDLRNVASSRKDKPLK